MFFNVNVTNIGIIFDSRSVSPQKVELPINNRAYFHALCVKTAATEELPFFRHNILYFAFSAFFNFFAANISYKQTSPSPGSGQSKNHFQGHSSL